MEDPHSAAWLFEQCEDCDGFPWPSGLGFQVATERICGRRGPQYHVSPILKHGMRAPVSLRIDRERSRYGRRRWHNHSPNGGATFTSCPRNRVAERRLARIERLYDAEAYLPLPIGCSAALIGRRMPGPTRQKAHEHTYCYHVDETFLRIQDDTVNLPLTSF